MGLQTPRGIQWALCSDGPRAESIRNVLRSGEVDRPDGWALQFAAALRSTVPHPCSTVRCGGAEVNAAHTSIANKRVGRNGAAGTIPIK